MSIDIYLRLSAISGFTEKEEGIRLAKKIIPNANDAEIEYALYGDCDTIESVSRIKRLSSYYAAV